MAPLKIARFMCPWFPCWKHLLFLMVEYTIYYKIYCKKLSWSIPKLCEGRTRNTQLIYSVGLIKLNWSAELIDCVKLSQFNGPYSLNFQTIGQERELAIIVILVVGELFLEQVVLERMPNVPHWHSHQPGTALGDGGTWCTTVAPGQGDGAGRWWWQDYVTSGTAPG